MSAESDCLNYSSCAAGQPDYRPHLTGIRRGLKPIGFGVDSSDERIVLQ
jgi:hypothetical protein